MKEESHCYKPELITGEGDFILWSSNDFEEDRTVYLRHREEVLETEVPYRLSMRFKESELLALKKCIDNFLEEAGK